MGDEQNYDRGSDISGVAPSSLQSALLADSRCVVQITSNFVVSTDTLNHNLTPVTINITAFLDMTLCNVVDIYECSGGTCCAHVQSRRARRVEKGSLM